MKNVLVNSSEKTIDFKPLALVFLCLLSFTAVAQSDTTDQQPQTQSQVLTSKAELKSEIPVCIMMFIAGAADGLSQDLLFHYHEFKRSTGLTGTQYWDPDISWRNKYKNGDPAQGAKFYGSTTFLFGLTDGYHASRSIRDSMVILSLTTSKKSKSKKETLRKAALYTASYGAGFTLVYDYLIR